MDCLVVRLQADGKVWSIVSVPDCHENWRLAKLIINVLNPAFTISLFCLGATYSRWIFVSTARAAPVPAALR